MKLKILLSILLLMSLATTVTAQKVSVDKSTGYLKIIPDTLVVEKIVRKDTIIYVDKVIVKDSIVYVTKVVYKDTCTITIPTPPTTPTIKYMSLPLGQTRVLNGLSNVVIENLRFVNVTGSSVLRITNCKNITIRNCFFDRSAYEAIDIENSDGVLVEKNLFYSVTSGVYALSSSNIRVINNQAISVKRNSTGHRGQLVQFNGVGGVNNQIINNRSESFSGDNSGPEDHISLFNSSNVVVRGNILRGGGPSDSGSGIMTGDHGGSNQLVENNILVNTGNAGIGVAGGSDIRILNNKIHSDKTAVSNNPLYVWKQGDAPNCDQITISGNQGQWLHKTGYNNGGWNAGNCTNVSFTPLTPLPLEQFNVPSHLIDFVTPAELLQIRSNK